MPPRYAYWTILVDGGPTAFRAAEREELLPTLKRLQAKQPDAVMKWFEKGRLWESRDEARDKLSAGFTVGTDGELVPPAEGERPRTKSWRPGGEHRDPREKYQLAKKAKWQAFKKMVRSRPGHGPKPDQEDAFAPFGDDESIDVPPAGPGAPDVETDGGAKPHDETFEGQDRPFDEGEGQAPPADVDWRGRPKPAAGPDAPKRAWSDRPRAPRTFDRGGDRPRGPKPEWRDRGPKTFDRGDDRPRGPKPEWRDRGPKSFDRGGYRHGPKLEWRDRGPKIPTAATTDRVRPKLEMARPRTLGNLDRGVTGHVTQA
ncbi:MAG: hypothetical protein R2708_03425 [Vicinamibacterales bacterium]